MFKNKKAFYIFFIILCEIIFLGVSIPIYPDDYWWHVKIGEWITNNFSLNIPQNLSWLSSEIELNWINHSWLCEILLFGLKTIFNDYSTIIYMMVFNLISYGVIYFTIKDKLKENQTFFTLFTFFYFVVFQFLLAPRPYILGFLFLLLLIYNLENIKNNNKYNICLLAITFILWTNCHGGSIILAILFSGYYLVFSLINIETKYITIKKQENEQIKKYFITTICSIICSFINPYTYKTIFYILKGDVTTNYIPEWKSIFEFNQPFYYIIVFGTLILALIKLKKNDISNTLIICGLCILSCLHMRYVEYLIILFPIYLIHCYKFEIKKIFIKKIGIFITFLSAVIGIMLLSENKDILIRPVPTEILEEIKDSEKIFNDYDFGGYLIYNEIPVFWDSRADLYVDSGILMQSFMFEENDLEKEEMNAFLEKYQFEYIVIKKDRGLNKFLETIDSYKKTIEKENTVLYERIN